MQTKGTVRPRASSTREISVFATRLDKLFVQWERKHGRPLSYDEVAERMIATGCRISPPYLSQLRSGRRTNPSTAVINALASEFKVDPYFLHGLDGGLDDCGVVDRLSDPSLRRLVRTAVGLSDASQTLLISVADKLRRAEYLIHTTVEV